LKNQNLKNLAISISILVFFAFGGKAQTVYLPKLAAYWSFDSVAEKNMAFEKVGGRFDPIIGYSKHLEGVSGPCLKLDGYTTKIIHENFQLTGSEGFAIEAWVALQSLPWNWSAIVNQRVGSEVLNSLKTQPKHNFFFGVNAFGQLGFQLNINGKMVECLSVKKLALLQWNHVVATYNGKDLMKVYINGEMAGEQIIDGSFDTESKGELWIGMNLENLGPVGSEREASENIHSPMVIHGLLDEVKIYEGIFDSNEIKATYQNFKPKQEKPLKWEKLPSGPESKTNRFDAYYTRLNYSDEWEQRWRIGGTPDILITFDKLPIRFIFWRGTGYGGAWVTEHGIWMGDQSLERAGKGKSPLGCSEHMSDKQTRYAQVRIIEKNDVRIVIQWRYAVSDILYNIFGATESTDWGEWAEEYYYIYPDGVSTRHQTLWTEHLSHEWQETIVLNQAGTFPEDNIETEAMTLGNMDGEFATYSWADDAPEKFDSPQNIAIQKVNLKSEFKPFIVFEPGVKIKPFRGAIRPELSKFPWWNHWPVAQLPNDGRRAFAPDRPSHSSLAQAIEGSSVIHDNKNGSYSVTTLIGLSNNSDKHLAELANSWNNPATLEINTTEFEFLGYDKHQKAYVLNNSKSTTSQLKFNLNPQNETAILNPCFVIKNWGNGIPNLAISGKEITHGDAFRYGFEQTIGGTDLVIWLELESKKPRTIKIYI
jgi:hypothetical protein